MRRRENVNAKVMNLNMSNRRLSRIFLLEYATALCDLFAALGARGASALTASGDLGVGAGDCEDDS